MTKTIITSILMTIVLTMLVGIIYPLVMTGFSQLVFPNQANGSLVYRGDSVIGSAILGQQFASAKFFRSRPSANNYDAANSGGTNLGPTSKALIDRITHDRDSLRKLYPELPDTLPPDMLTASASGLDPDITPANAMDQAPIVAKSNNLPLDTVLALVRKHIQGRDLGFLGEPRVNVLELNLDLLNTLKHKNSY